MATDEWPTKAALKLLRARVQCQNAGPSLAAAKAQILPFLAIQYIQTVHSHQLRAQKQQDRVLQHP